MFTLLSEEALESRRGACHFRDTAIIEGLCDFDAVLTFLGYTTKSVVPCLTYSARKQGYLSSFCGHALHTVISTIVR